MRAIAAFTMAWSDVNDVEAPLPSGTAAIRSEGSRRSMKAFTECGYSLRRQPDIGLVHRKYDEPSTGGVLVVE